MAPTRAPELQPDERDPVVVDLRQRLEHVDRTPCRDDRGDGRLALRNELLRRRPGRRRQLGHRDRQRHDATGGHPRRRHEQLGAVAARPVQVDDGRKRPLPGRHGEHRVDALAGARERDVVNGDRVAVVDDAAVDIVERRRGVVGERRALGCCPSCASGVSHHTQPRSRAGRQRRSASSFIEQSGWSDSNRRLLASQTRAL